jgi:molecular chaperone DnaK
LNEEIEKLKKKLENRDELKATEVKEIVGSVQQQSLKLFEAAYKKMAAQNQQSSAGSADPKQEGNDSAKPEGGEDQTKANK